MNILIISVRVLVLLNNINIEQLTYLSSEIVNRLNQPTPFINQTSISYEEFLNKDKHIFLNQESNNILKKVTYTKDENKIDEQ